MTSNVSRYLFLDGLRGITACYVMVYHFIAWIPSALPRWITRLQTPFLFGHVAVSIFIVLSGFSLMLPVVHSHDFQLRGGLRGYFMRRAKRILPPYFGALALSMVVVWLTSMQASERVGPSELSARNVVEHLFLVHNLDHTSAFAINMAHWSIAAEWQIYFIFAIVLLPFWRIAGRLVTLLVAFSLSIVPLLVAPSQYNLAWTCPWYIGLFALGMITATIDASIVSVRVRLLLVILLAIFGSIYLFVNHLSRIAQPNVCFNFIKDSIAGLMVACGLFLGVTYNKAQHGHSRILSILQSRPIMALGSISYSLYLLHAAVLTICFWTAAEFHLSDLSSFWLRATIGVLLSLTLAFLSYIYLEKPFLSTRSKSG